MEIEIGMEIEIEYMHALHFLNEGVKNGGSSLNFLKEGVEDGGFAIHFSRWTGGWRLRSSFSKMRSGRWAHRSSHFR